MSSVALTNRSVSRLGNLIPRTQKEIVLLLCFGSGCFDQHARKRSETTSTIPAITIEARLLMRFWPNACVSDRRQRETDSKTEPGVEAASCSLEAMVGQSVLRSYCVLLSRSSVAVVDFDTRAMASGIQMRHGFLTRSSRQELVLSVEDTNTSPLIKRMSIECL